VVLFPAAWIGIGRDGSVEMLAVEAEGKPEKIGLTSAVVEARFGVIGELVRGDVED